MTLIQGDFTPEYRTQVVAYLKSFGIDRTRAALETIWHPSFSRALLKSILKKEGW